MSARLEPETNWKDSLTLLACIAIIFGIVIWSARCDDKSSNTPQTTKPVVNIDSILNTNDSIKYVIKQKDSIKYDEVFKVRNLDNDSTVKLFKELVRE